MAIQTQRSQSRSSSARQPQGPQPGGVGPSSSPALGRRTFLVRTGARRALAWARGTLRGQFISQAVLLLILAVTLGLVVQGAFRHANDELNAIVADSIPSIDAAQMMGRYIQDIDARAADFISTGGLNDPLPCTLPVSQYQPGDVSVHECDGLTINYDITLFNQALYKASRNVTFPGERTAIERITSGFEEYVSDITVMIHEYDLAADKTNPQDEHIRRARKAYMSASNVLLKHITRPSALDVNGLHVYNEEHVPSCVIEDPLGDRELLSWQWPNASLEVNINCLSSINRAHLNTTYENMQSTQTIMAVLLCLFCLILGVFLIVTTLRMVAITHRIINPGLSLALLLMIIFSIPLLSHYIVLGGRDGKFSQIVKDDYESVFYADNLNRYGNEASADRIRWLIALQDGDQPQVDRWAEEWENNTKRVKGLITKAQQNYTWTEEADPLAQLRTNWNDYEVVDKDIRDQGQHGHFDEAEKIITQRSSPALSKFTDAVDALSAANRGHLDQTYTETRDSTAFDMGWYIILFPFIGLLAVWGIWLRLKDF